MLTRYNIEKWYKMLTGKSILHVNQDIGKVYSKNEIKGYYNNLTEKVLKDDNFESITIPRTKIDSNKDIVFPIAVFQYGLGAYDLFLIHNQTIYYEKFKTMSEWALQNQDINGEWNTFFFSTPDNPYSAMAQGEGASLLIRAHKEFNEEKYFIGAKKAIEFMLIPIEKGGTTLYHKL